MSNVPEKIRVVEVLVSALEEVQHWSAEYFGAGNVSSGMALGIGAVGRKEGEAWAAKLEEFSSVCDGVVGQFGKKLGVGEGFVTKKSSGVSVVILLCRLRRRVPCASALARANTPPFATVADTSPRLRPGHVVGRTPDAAV